MPYPAALLYLPGSHAVHGVLKAKDESLVGKAGAAFSLLSHAFDKADPKAKAKAGAKPGAAGAKRLMQCFGRNAHAFGSPLRAHALFLKMLGESARVNPHRGQRCICCHCIDGLRHR